MLYWVRQKLAERNTLPWLRVCIQGIHTVEHLAYLRQHIFQLHSHLEAQLSMYQRNMPRMTCFVWLRSDLWTRESIHRGISTFGNNNNDVTCALLKQRTIWITLYGFLFTNSILCSIWHVKYYIYLLTCLLTYILGMLIEMSGDGLHGSSKTELLNLPSRLPWSIYSIYVRIQKSVDCYQYFVGLHHRQGLALLMASVRRSSVNTWKFNPSPKTQFYINWFKFWRGWLC